jgi:hypothetical protein
MQPHAMAGAPTGCYPPLMSGVAGSHWLPFRLANRRTDPVIAKSDSGMPAAPNDSGREDAERLIAL